MGSTPRTPREEEQRVQLRTLLIASAASATAALVTSRLWIAGTWIAAAMTPVIVTLVSEILRRPTERIARGITVDRPALPDPDAPPAAAAQRVAERLRAEDPARALPDPEASRPVRVYRSGPPPRPERRRIAYRVVFGTAAIAFVIGVLALTVPELIAGSSFGKNDARTTLFRGSKNKTGSEDKAKTTTEPTETERTETQPETDTETTPTETQTETTPTVPEQQPPAVPPADTETTPPSTTTTP
jgi:hypothetical protein